MHIEAMDFLKSVKRLHPAYFKKTKVLEVGSLNINGSVRELFSYWCDYTGIDLIKGRGVDVVCKSKDFFAPKEFDVVVTTEALEHDNTWKETLISMYQNLKPLGLFIMTCASSTRPEHGTKRTTPQDSPATTDYYRNISKADFMQALPERMFINYYLENGRGLQDLYFFGIKT